MNEHARAVDDEPVSAEKNCNALKGELARSQVGNSNFGSCICGLLYAFATSSPVARSSHLLPSMRKARIFLGSNMDKNVHWKQGDFI